MLCCPCAIQPTPWGSPDARRRLRGLTRDGDFDVAIGDRPAVAKCQHADTFVSIHFNAPPDNNPTTRGTELYVRAKSKNNVNRGEDVALANAIMRAVVPAIPGGSDRGVRDDTTKKPGSLGVLDDASLGNTAAHHPVRSCLIEVEYFTNVAADNLINGPGSAAARTRIARAMAEGIILDLLART
jgi:N-acetylmuramoyl-L-alanine amidase